MDRNHFVSVAGLVLNNSNEILLVKSPLRGWEFPGGVVESGESLQSALKREILEESGVDIEIIINIKNASVWEGLGIGSLVFFAQR